MERMGVPRRPGDGGHLVIAPPANGLFYTLSRTEPANWRRTHRIRMLAGRAIRCSCKGGYYRGKCWAMAEATAAANPRATQTARKALS